MLVTIASVEASGRIQFETPYGTGIGAWHGDPPGVGEDFVVEFELDEDQNSGLNVDALQGTHAPAISIHEG